MRPVWSPERRRNEKEAKQDDKQKRQKSQGLNMVLKQKAAKSTMPNSELDPRQCRDCKLITVPPHWGEECPMRETVLVVGRGDSESS